jgi:hypothetical protein
MLTGAHIGKGLHWASPLIRFLMWACVLVGLGILGRFIYGVTKSGDLAKEIGPVIRLALLFGTVWLPPAVCLGLWDKGRDGPQSVLVYLLALLSLAFAAFVLVVSQLFAVFS